MRPAAVASHDLSRVRCPAAAAAAREKAEPARGPSPIVAAEPTTGAVRVRGVARAGHLTIFSRQHARRRRRRRRTFGEKNTNYHRFYYHRRRHRHRHHHLCFHRRRARYTRSSLLRRVYVTRYG